MALSDPICDTHPRGSLKFSGRHVVRHLFFGLLLSFVPGLVHSDPVLQIIDRAMIYGIAALGLNIIFGLGGLLSIAQGAIMGIGAYVLVFTTGGVFGLIPSMIFACLSSAAVSGVIGLASGRTRSHYFIILTLALAETEILLIQNNPDLTGGSNGLPLEVSPTIVGLDLTSSTGFFFFAMPLLLISWYLADCFKRSRPGLALRVLATDEYLAMAVGIATGQARFNATLIGGAFAGLAGALLAIGDAYIGPQNFDLDTASLLLLIIVLGGPGSNGGTVVAAIVLTLLVQGTLTLTTLGQFIYGAAIIVLIIAAPGGLAGLTRIAVVKASRLLRAITFRRRGHDRGA